MCRVNTLSSVHRLYDANMSLCALVTVERLGNILPTPGTRRVEDFDKYG